MAPSAHTLEKRIKQIIMMMMVMMMEGSGAASSRSPPSSSSLLSLLLSRSLSDDAVIMKAKPMNREAFWGSGPWVLATSPD